VVLPAPASTAEVETTEIRAKSDAKACPRMPLLVDSVSFLTVDFRQKGVYASYTHIVTDARLPANQIVVNQISTTWNRKSIAFENADTT
jgi:hypothetical protein